MCKCKPHVFRNQARPPHVLIRRDAVLFTLASNVVFDELDSWIASHRCEEPGTLNRREIPIVEPRQWEVFLGRP